ncbi:hypothetical protein [Arthrobacter sp. NPDC056493]|uniref:hypothetical protein n=1 Tax=Arthrobacter sp. NPDC056493 TaxID=3345839 RepID=UPI00366B4DE9
MAGSISREAHGLSDSGKASAAAAGGKGVLERQFRFLVDEPSGHHEVAGNPFRAVGFQGLDLVLRGAVEFLARDVLVDFGRTLTVRAVRAAEVAGVRNADGPVLSPVAAELAGAGVAAVKVSGSSVLPLTAVLPTGTVLAGCPVLPVTERPAVVSATKGAAVAVALATRTVTKRLTVTITKRLPLTTTKTAAITLALTTRTVTKRLTVTITKRLTLTTTKTAAITLALTTRTVTKRAAVAFAKAATLTLAFTARAVTKRLTVTITKRLTLTTTKTAAITPTLTARTITKRLTVRVTAGTAAITGAEAPRIPAGIIGPPKRAPLPSPVASRVPPVISAAVTAALVLSHGGFLL